jgi:CRISPR system Cascade subunit CasE
VTDLVIAKARLRRDVPAVSFAALLVPANEDQRIGASHRLLWSLYSDTPDRERDFLWRQTGPGEFLMLGSRAPVDTHGLFELEHKPFAPALFAGQHLAFALRANATRRVSRGRYVDVVMHALHPLPREARAVQREQVTQEAATVWLQQQGARSGFELVTDTLRVEGYQQVRVPRGQARPIQYSVIDLVGELVVREPEQFLAVVAAGFGKARAFGCGLMLIRRA